jgi:MFS family permease
VRVGKTVQTIKQGGAAFRRAGAIFLVSCSAMGLAAGLPAWGALLLLLGAVVLHTYGELWQSSAMYALDFGLAPPNAQGQYQGLVGMGNFAGQALSPFILIGVVLSGGRLGFVIIGAWFALLGLVTRHSPVGRADPSGRAPGRPRGRADNNRGLGRGRASDRHRPVTPSGGKTGPDHNEHLSRAWPLDPATVRKRKCVAMSKVLVSGLVGTLWSICDIADRSEVRYDRSRSAADVGRGGAAGGGVE